MEAMLERLMWVIDGGNPHAAWTTIALRVSLICLSVFMLVQLLGIVGTRWGEKNATLKSFVASVLFHVWAGLLWTTVAPASGWIDGPADKFTLEEPPPTPIQFADDAAGGNDEAPLEQNSLQSRLASSSSATRKPLERSVREADMAELPSIPDRAENSLEIAGPTPIPAMKTTADIAPASPQAMAVEETTNRAPAPMAASPTPNDMTARRDADLGLPALSRQTLTRNPANLESIGDRSLPAGGADRAAPQAALEASRVPLMNATDAEPVPNALDGPAVIRRSAPLAAPVPSVLPGAEGPSSEPNAQPAATTAARFTRQTIQRSNIPQAGTSPVPIPSTNMRTMERTTDAVTRDARALLTSSPSTTSSSETEIAIPAIEVASRPLGPTIQRRPAAFTPEAYRNRRLEQRREIALRNGGSEASESAVERALAWLAQVQEKDDYWNASRWGGGIAKRSPEDPPDLVDRKGSGLNADTGLTGLTVLAFLGAGYTHEEGRYASQVRRSLDWMIRQQRADGYLGGNANYYDAMYCHGIATYALAEAYAMQADKSRYPKLRTAVANAAGFIAQMQNKDGGWRYRKDMAESDMSMFGWQMMALKSAENAGFQLPPEVEPGMLKFLKTHSRGKAGGLAAYRADCPPSPAMTAEALYSKQVLGLRRDNPASLEAVEYMTQHLPRISETNQYYWYYGTMAMFQYGGEPWEKWNDATRDSLIRLQRTQGPEAGSWDPKDPWGGIGGRLYSTTLSTLSLEVYYRFLPLYQLEHFQR